MLIVALLGWVQAAPALDFTPAERGRILSHGPWPPQPRPDPSNAVDANPIAIALGHQLFVSKAVSASKNLACASCHIPSRAFQDGRSNSRLGRNTPSVVDAVHRNWFGWDGATDSLWAASLAPLTARDEMAATAQTLSSLLQQDPKLGGPYRQLFGDPLADVTVLVNASKALAAYQATLVSGRSSFDAFRDGFVGTVPPAQTSYSVAAQRGLKLFVGEARCFLCHTGPSFSNGEFADIGRKFFTKTGADPGRWGGLKTLLASPFNRLGEFSDAPGQTPSDTSTRHVTLEPRHFGEFKVPSLRGLTLTAPYFHDGSAKTLREVVKHYSNLDPNRIHSDGAAVLQPLKLTPRQIDDLVTFLQSLSPQNAAKGSK